MLLRPLLMEHPARLLGSGYPSNTLLQKERFGWYKLHQSVKALLVNQQPH